MIRLWLWVSGRKTTEMKWHYLHIFFRTCYHHDSSLMMLSLIPWLRECLSGFSPVKSSCPLFLLYSLESSPYSRLKPGGVKLHLLKEGATTEFIYNSSVEDSPLSLHLFICSFIYLYQFVLTDIYFSPWTIIQCHIIYFVTQIISALAIQGSFRLVPESLWHAPTLS